MRITSALAAIVVLLPLSAAPPRRAPASAIPNDNRAPGGQLRDNVLRIALEAKPTTWHPNGDSLPGIEIEGFSEPGKSPQIPGPLIRVPEGTQIRVSVRNTFARETLTFHLPRSGTSSDPAGPTDSIVVPPGSTQEIRSTVRPGSHLYRATLGDTIGKQARISGALTGALIVDSAGSSPRANDRIFVLHMAVDSIDPFLQVPASDRSVFAINGRSWPHTERLTATVGDTVRWRVINASWDVHPMHLHGFYFQVDAHDGPRAPLPNESHPRRVVTERMMELATMSMTWVPERPGNWLFHCHFQDHLVPRGPFNVTTSDGRTQRISPPMPHDPSVHENHATTGMAGLVLGIDVRPRQGDRVVEPERPARHLRLVAVEDSGFPSTAPSMRFMVEEMRGGTRTVSSAPFGSPPINLTRGEPVSITVVNHLREPTTVHWHGIELGSFFDGVAGFAGSGARLAPMIAPRDSFEARFTPPRAGTFLYHSHVDEPRQHRAGLIGALIVREPATRDSARDLVFVLKTARQGAQAPLPVEINGTSNPDTVVLRAGERYRLRFAAMTTANPLATIWITARPDSVFLRPVDDTLVASWTPLAKDGADLPPADRSPRLAKQIISMGETYDFELTPSRRGMMRIEVRAQLGRERLFVRVPLRVE